MLGLGAGGLARLASNLLRDAMPGSIPTLSAQAPPPVRTVGWARPPRESAEGRLIHDMVTHPGDYPSGRLLKLLATAPHPAVRDVAARRLGVMRSVVTDPTVAETLRRRLAEERDPVVRSSLKAALGGQNP